MNRTERRKQEKEMLKNAAKKFAVKFTMSLAKDNTYSMLSVFDMKVVKDLETVDYDNDKCYDILLESSPNIIAKLQGNAKTPKEEDAVLQCMRNVSLAVLKMIQLDPYKSAGIIPNAVMDMNLDEDEDGNVGFNLLPGGFSSMNIQKGIANVVKARDTDLMAIIA